jgi:hypothetical protein
LDVILSLEEYYDVSDVSEEKLLAFGSVGFSRLRPVYDIHALSIV